MLSSQREKLDNDPYVWHGKVKAALGVALLRAQDEAKSLFESFRTPFLVYHGTADGLCLIEGSRVVYEASPSEDKTLKVGWKEFY